MTLVISIRLLSLAFGHIDSQKKIRMLVIKPPYDTIGPNHRSDQSMRGRSRRTGVTVGRSGSMTPKDAVS
jgi:hypothetical protein